MAGCNGKTAALAVRKPSETKLLKSARLALERAESAYKKSQSEYDNATRGMSSSDEVRWQYTEEGKRIVKENSKLFYAYRRAQDDYTAIKEGRNPSDAQNEPEKITASQFWARARLAKHFRRLGKRY